MQNCEPCDFDLCDDCYAGFQQGSTALDLAELKGHAAVAALLRQAVEDRAQQQAQTDRAKREPRAEEGEPPAAEALRAELRPLKLRALTKRAELAGVDEDLLDAAEDTASVIELIVATETEKAADAAAKLDALRAELSTLALRALTKRAEAMGVVDAKLDAAESKEQVISLILEVAAAAGGGIRDSTAEAEPEPVAQPTSVQESHGQVSQPGDEFDFVFSNKTASDGLCLTIRAKLTARGLRVWQQKTNIPKDSDNWFNEWYPSAVKSRKIVCFITVDYLKSPYCMKEFGIALGSHKLLVVACEPLAQINAVDPSAYPHASNALAYLLNGGQVIFHDTEDVVAEILKFA
eukprot:COSAG02_NODE_482_length_21409_cov_126.131018_9_plen_349_part_00